MYMCYKSNVLGYYQLLSMRPIQPPSTIIFLQCFNCIQCGSSRLPCNFYNLYDLQHQVRSSVNRKMDRFASWINISLLNIHAN